MTAASRVHARRPSLEGVVGRSREQRVPRLTVRRPPREGRLELADRRAGRFPDLYVQVVEVVVVVLVSRQVIAEENVPPADFRVALREDVAEDAPRLR